MYKIQKTNRRIEDEVRIEAGDEELVLPVSISVDDVARQLPGLQRELLLAQDGLKGALASDDPGIMEAAHESLCKAVLQLLRLIFGPDGADRIDSFYDGQMMEALTDFAPYITEAIIPRVSRAQRNLADSYKSFRV